MNAEIDTCLRSFFSFLYYSEEVPSLEQGLQESRGKAYLIFVNQVLRDASETCGLVIFPIRPAKKETQGYDFVIHEKQKRRTYA